MGPFPGTDKEGAKGEDMKQCIGIDVGGTTIKFGLFFEDGRLVKKWEIPTRTGGRKEKLYQDIAS